MDVREYIAGLHKAQRLAVIEFAKLPRTHEGRGIVTTAYDREIASAWVLLSELVRLKVTLPVEAFYREGELSQENADLLTSLGLDLRLRVLHDPVTIRFAVKPLAIWRSSFKEVLWLDCDNFPLRDPLFLFDDPEYREKGSLFWRDVSGIDRGMVWHPSLPVWTIFNVPANDAEEFETGQLMIDKDKRWAELGLTVHFAQQAGDYYRHVYGDKDTFRLAWQNLAAARKTGPGGGGGYLSNPAIVPYGFMPYGPFHMGRQNTHHKWGGGSVMVQRDRHGAPLFNHRNLFKLTLGENVFNADVTNEATYHAHIETLRQRTTGRSLPAAI